MGSFERVSVHVYKWVDRKRVTFSVNIKIGFCSIVQKLKFLKNSFERKELICIKEAYLVNK